MITLLLRERIIACLKIDSIDFLKVNLRLDVSALMREKATEKLYQKYSRSIQTTCVVRKYLSRSKHTEMGARNCLEDTCWRLLIRV